MKDAVFLSVDILYVTAVTTWYGSQTLDWSPILVTFFPKFTLYFVQLSPRSFSALIYHTELEPINIETHTNIILYFSATLTM